MKLIKKLTNEELSKNYKYINNYILCIFVAHENIHRHIGYIVIKV